MTHLHAAAERLVRGRPRRSAPSADAPYAVTKHAAVALAEWWSINHRDSGVRISRLCPIGVDTQMLSSGQEPDSLGVRVSAHAVHRSGSVLTPEVVAERVIHSVRAENFFVLPDAEIDEHLRRRCADHERRLDGMRRSKTSLAAEEPWD